MTIQEVVNRTGLSSTTVYKAFIELAKIGYAHKEKHKWYACEEKLEEYFQKHIKNYKH